MKLRCNNVMWTVEMIKDMHIFMVGNGETIDEGAWA